jgi:hypothetical protein
MLYGSYTEVIYVLDFALLKPLTYNSSEVEMSALLKDLLNNVRTRGYSAYQKLKSIAHE